MNLDYVYQMFNFMRSSVCDQMCVIANAATRRAEKIAIIILGASRENVGACSKFRMVNMVKHSFRPLL